MILQSNVVFRMKHYWRRELKDPVQLGVGINPLMKSLKLKPSTEPCVVFPRAQ